MPVHVVVVPFQLPINGPWITSGPLFHVRDLDKALSSQLWSGTSLAIVLITENDSADGRLVGLSLSVSVSSFSFKYVCLKEKVTAIKLEGIAHLNYFIKKKERKKKKSPIVQ